MAAATAVALVMTPSPKTFVDGISSKEMWAGLNDRMWPQDAWFGIVPRHNQRTADVKATTPKTLPLATGSLPDQQHQEAE